MVVDLDISRGRGEADEMLRDLPIENIGDVISPCTKIAQGAWGWLVLIDIPSQLENRDESVEGLGDPLELDQFSSSHKSSDSWYPPRIGSPPVQNQSPEIDR